jgi:hypothetical protein
MLAQPASPIAPATAAATMRSRLPSSSEIRRITVFAVFAVFAFWDWLAGAGPAGR